METFHVIAPTTAQGQIIDVKYKSASLIFFPAIIELVRELVTSNMHNKFGKDT